MFRRHRNASYACTISKMDPLLRLWVLRLLVPLGGHQEFITKHGFQEDSIAIFLGLKQGVIFDGEGFKNEKEKYSEKKAREKLQKCYFSAEKELSKSTFSGFFKRNIKRLSDLIGLSKIEQQILAFVVILRNEQILEEASSFLGELSSVKLYKVLAVLLDRQEKEIRVALCSAGLLSRSGIVTIDRDNAYHLRLKLDVLSDSFVDQIYSTDTDPIELLRDTVYCSSAAELSIDDYKHIKPVPLLRSLIHKSIKQKRKGVNIFFYGAPGTGKSQLSKVLAQEVGCELFEISTTDEEGDPIDGERRLRALKAGQCFFTGRKSIFLFDEVEDVFNDGHWFLGTKSTAQKHKGWMNQMLEENPVPTFWVSNSGDGIDPAFIRRFDMIVELPVPPIKQRERIIKQACNEFLDDKSVRYFASSDVLAPAVITRAASVLETIRDDLTEDKLVPAFELLINNTLETQGHKTLKQYDPNQLPETYNPNIINADIDLSEITDGLKNAQSGRLCLYGPPGTGKTAYGRWLSEQLDRPLLLKKGSDLISMWVGGTEKNIANAFKEAESEHAILMIDEVDSFLQDRRSAQHSWELTAVNEMLTQMESFSGVFIASTNLMDNLDQASLRRFDLKLKFGFLKQTQAWELLLNYCSVFGIDKPANDVAPDLACLHNLTPGDFAAIARQNRFKPIKSAGDFIVALTGECQVKDNVKSPMGFIH
jgi:transitional endoplasmic reticulum ATPase